MSITAESDRKYWPTILAGLVAALLATGAGLTMWGGGSRGGGSDAGRPGRAPAATEGTTIKQPKWRVHFAAGGFGTVPKQRRKRISAQRTALVSLVRDVYDAMFLAPSNLEKSLKSSFTAPAASALAKTKAGLPRGAEQVKIRKRLTRLAVDRSSPTRATARVKLIAKGATSKSRFALTHVASLYLLRNGKGWKVIGFDIDQVPYRKTKGKDAKKGDAKSGNKRPARRDEKGGRR